MPFQKNGVFQQIDLNNYKIAGQNIDWLIFVLIIYIFQRLVWFFLVMSPELFTGPILIIILFK